MSEQETPNPDAPIISDNTTKEELLKMLENDSVDIHEGTSQYQGYHSKVSKKDFAQKVSQSQKNQALYNIVKDLSWEERYEFVNVNKTKGNRLFKKKEYKEASEVYLESLVGLVLGTGDKEKDDRMRFELQIPILNNIASCMINLELYGNAQRICDKSIELGPQVFKSYVKRAQAFAGLLHFDKAKADFQKALQIADNQQDQNDIKRLYSKMLQQKTEEQQKYKNFFEKKKGNKDDGKEEEEEEDNDENPGKVLSFNDELEQHSKYGVLKYPAFYVNKILSKIGCKRKNQKIKYTTKNKKAQQSDSEEDSE